MKTVNNFGEAADIPNVIRRHMRPDGKVDAYQEGDILPPELTPIANPNAAQLEALNAQLTNYAIAKAATGTGAEKAALKAIVDQIDALT